MKLFSCGYWNLKSTVSCPFSSSRWRKRLCLEELESRLVPSGYQPTAAETQFLELLNNARANPAAYGASIGVDLSYIAPSPPLTFDTRLIQAARDHSQDMNDRQYFDHYTPEGIGPDTRVTNAGYPGTFTGESLDGGPALPADALKDLIIDAGVPDLGHRNHLLGYGPYNPIGFQQQVGVGIVFGNGPYHYYYTIDTGSLDFSDDLVNYSPSFLTGVVYSDDNGNGKYDIGEGLGGVTLSVNGVAMATTWDTGGYSIPLAPGTYTVTASGGGLYSPVTQTVTIGATNVRLNFTPPFLTGVVYSDENANGKYDIGEGLGGVTLSVNGVATATSGDRGGYRISLAPGTYTVTASGGGLYSPVTQTVTIGATSVRLNFTPPKMWAPLTPLPTACSSPAAVTGADGLIYVFGGWGANSQPLHSAEAYDPGTGAWTVLADMPTARGSLAAVQGGDGRIYVIGGVDGNNHIVTTVEVYTPSTNTWAPGASLQTPRADLAAAAGLDGRLYAIGGLKPQSPPLASMEVFDPAGGAWVTSSAPLPAARWGLAATAGADGRIYALGGLDSTGKVQADAAVYDPTTGAWTSVASLPGPRADLAAVTGPDGRIYVLGGRGTNNDDSYLAGTYAYSPASNHWSVVADSLTPRAGLAAAAGADGRLYAFGGYNGSPINGGVSPLNTAEVLSLAGQLQYSSATVTAEETSGSATITVSRAGASFGQVTVHYATSDGTAKAGTDYTTTSGDLTFADGETSKTITVPLLDDGQNGGENKTVNLALSSPTGGATLGSLTTAVLTIIEPPQLVLTSSPLTLTAAVPGGPVTVALEDQNGNMVPAGSGGLTVHLNTTSSSGTFLDSQGQPLAGASLTIPEGSAAAVFFYKDTKSGTPVLTVAATGLASVTQQETVNAASPSTVVFTTPSHTLSVGNASAPLGVQVVDAFGNPSPAGTAGVVVNLTSTSAGGTFLDANGHPLSSPSVTIAPGASAANFEYEDTQTGSPTVTAGAAGLVAAAQQEVVTGTNEAFPVTASPIIATAGQTFSGTVATFTIANSAVAASAFSATIAWGDGSTSPVVPAGGSGSFTVSGSHSYAQEGLYQVSISVTENNGDTGAGFGLAHVARVGPPPRGLGALSSLVAHSGEYYANIVIAAYRRFLGRVPMASEVAAWVGLMQQGLTNERLEAGFIGSPEYITNHGGQGAGWVTGMYQDLLGRNPAPSEVNAWMQALAAGAAPTQVAYGFAASPEREAQRVAADYQRYLGRAPQPSEVAAWVGLFEAGYRNEDVVAGFVASPEYFQTHDDNIADWLLQAYHDIFGRAPSAGEYQNWENYLKNLP
jgi:N-acetylneuraminic acid mutarotase/uncharacterized protein YkwD